MSGTRWTGQLQGSLVRGQLPAAAVFPEQAANPIQQGGFTAAGGSCHGHQSPRPEFHSPGVPSGSSRAPVQGSQGVRLLQRGQGLAGNRSTLQARRGWLEQFALPAEFVVTGQCPQAEALGADHGTARWTASAVPGH